MENSNRYRFAGDYLTCPACGKPKKYRDYFDTATGQPVAHLECGECFSASCGFSVKPREYFAQHPEARNQAAPTNWQPLPPPPVSYIDRHHVTDYITNDLQKGNLTDYLLPIFGKDMMLPVLRKYGVGIDADGSIRWPQIDEQKRIREIKVQQHNRFSGHREGVTFTIHKTLRGKGELDPESTAEQCLFGQHLLDGCNEDTIVAITESEKTAIIFAMLLPQVVWLATGSESNFGLIRKVQKILRRCGSVTIYPDAGSGQKWREEAKSLTLNNVEVSDLCAGHPHNVDLADLLIYEFLSTHKQPQQQQLKFDEPTPAPIPTAEATTCAKSTPPAPRIIYKTPLFPETYESILSAMTAAEFNGIFSPEAVAEWQAAHTEPPF